MDTRGVSKVDVNQNPGARKTPIPNGTNTLTFVARYGFRHRGHVERVGDAFLDEFVAHVLDEVVDQLGQHREVVRCLE